MFSVSILSREFQSEKLMEAEDLPGKDFLTKATKRFLLSQVARGLDKTRGALKV